MAKNASPTGAKMVKITLVRSTIGFDKTQAKTVQGMGLRKIRQSVVRTDDEQTRGLIKTVHHLVQVEEV